MANPISKRRHWHPFLEEIIGGGGVKSEQDCTTGKLADEFQALRYIPGLLNNSGRSADEWARVLGEEPDTPYRETESYFPDLTPHDFLLMVENATRETRPEDETPDEKPEKLRRQADVIAFCARHSLPAEIVHKWVWITFPDKPPKETRELIKGAGFAWVKKRGRWAHSCGHYSWKRSKAPYDPREKYGAITIEREEKPRRMAASAFTDF